jgi:glycosyltransferase involved in cell wall biosynthesis
MAEETIKEENGLLKGGQQFPLNSEIKSEPIDIRPNPGSVSNEQNYLKSRRGIGICIISRGTVPIKWMMHMNRVKNSFPGGIFWKFLTVERLSWAAARNECVRKCRQNNFKWLFFIDDDVFIPENALDRFLKSEKDIISGIYWTKSENPSPVIFKEMGEGPIYNFPLDKIIPIGGSGLGCCLINLDVFDKFDEAGIPYFVENWVYTAPDGNKMKCPIGEDHYFFWKAKEFGYPAFADTGVLCDHYDPLKDKYYPGEEEVRRICKQKLTEEGRDDEIQRFDIQNLDPNKKTIVFYNDNTPFAGDEIARRGVGGSEHDIILLAKELAATNQYNVRVYCQCLREGTYDGIIYKDNSNFWKDIKSLNCDLFISSRNLKPFLEGNPKEYAKQTVLWGHDLALDPMWAGFELALSKIDKVVLLTEFHKRNILQQFPSLPADKIVILRNGVDSNRYKDRKPKVAGKCIYSSAPYRGLDVLLKIWPKIKQRAPQAELHIFSSIKVYGEFFDDSPWEDLYAAAKRMDGVHYHGTVRQDRLAQEQMSSELCLYPNTFLETGCNSAMECQVAGTPIIASNQGALPETIKEGCGVLISGIPYSPEYQEAFINAAVDLLTTDKGEKMAIECLKQDFSWKIITQEWINNFLTAGKPAPINWDEVYKKDLANERFNVNEKRFNYLKQWMKDGDKILDVGCGLGAFPRFIKKAFPKAEVWGTELSMYAMDYCRQSDKAIMFANHPMSGNFEAHYFDIINCSHTLEYADDKSGFIANLMELLKPDGTLLITTCRNNEWTCERLAKLSEPYKFQFHELPPPAEPEYIVSVKF